jgi:hypothetical protein
VYEPRRTRLTETFELLRALPTMPHRKLCTWRPCHAHNETMVDVASMRPLEWPLEKVRWQNPRIRALLGSVRSLERVLESNFAILHCSPTRLLEIWDTVRTVCWVVQTKITPLMEQPSALPDLDEAVRTARETLTFLDGEVFVHIDRFPDRPEDDQFDELRRTLCITIGKLHGFLVDTLGEILAADPRSQHDVDYFLARKFPRDVEESEWLQTSVERFEKDLSRLNARRHGDLGSVIDTMAKWGQLPPPEEWQRLAAFLETLESDLAPKISTLAGLRAIRLGELEVLQAHARDLPESCRVVGELYTTAGVILDTLTASLGKQDNEAKRTVAAEVERVLCSRIITCLRVVEDELRDMATFIPLWLSSIEKRRALMLRPNDDAANHADEEEPS